MSQKLNQVLAVERQIKSRATSEITQAHHAAQKPALFSGFSKEYHPKDDDGERFPPESLLVQKRAHQLVRDARRAFVELIDVTATKDAANCQAKANIVVNGQTLASDVPATTLLFLEKQLTDLHTFVSKLPTLDPAVEWRYDDATELYRSEPVETAKTKKIQKPIVLYDATDKHPAQTQLITEDVIVGTWRTIKQSGAIKERERGLLLERVEQLQKAVKFARESANTQEAPQKQVGGALFDFLLT